MKPRLSFIAIFAAVTISAGQAQSPAPTVIQSSTMDSKSLPTAIKTLQEMKVANDELLKKQEAALQRLDELQKAADELKIFGKRS